MVVLAIAILGSETTGLEGDWLLGDVVLGGEIYLATVGLTDVQLRNQRGSQSYGLPQLCGQTGGEDSVWCKLDAVGIKDVTIAEILEREPELREEIEEEIKNNNWGY